MYIVYRAAMIWPCSNGLTPVHYQVWWIKWGKLSLVLVTLHLGSLDGFRCRKVLESWAIMYCQIYTRVRAPKLLDKFCRMVRAFVAKTKGDEVASKASDQELMEIMMSR